MTLTIQSTLDILIMFLRGFLNLNKFEFEFDNTVNSRYLNHVPSGLSEFEFDNTVNSRYLNHVPSGLSEFE